MSGGAGGLKLEGTTERFMFANEPEMRRAVSTDQKQTWIACVFYTTDRTLQAQQTAAELNLKHNRKKQKAQTSCQYKPLLVHVTDDAAVDES